MDSLLFTLAIPVSPSELIINPLSDQSLDSLCPDPVKATKLKSCDFALFAASWFPQAGFEELRILSFLAYWLFAWDDEIDQESGVLAHDFTAADQYRRDTIEYVAQCLELETCDSSASSVQSDNDALWPPHPIVRSFDVIGKALCEAYDYGVSAPSFFKSITPFPMSAELYDHYSFKFVNCVSHSDQRQTFFEEMVYFLEKSEAEQQMKLSKLIPNVQEYNEIRLGTSAVGVIMAVLE
jgi:hypothetical protein